MTTLVLILHAFAAIIAFGLLPIPGIFAFIVGSKANIATIRRVFALAVARGKFAGPLAIIGALLGFELAWLLHFSYTESWLVAAYIAFALLLVIGLGYHNRWEERVLRAAINAPSDEQTPELRALFNEPMTIPAQAASIMLWFALFYLMIVRP